MSKFLELLKGAARSNTVQFNTIILTILTSLVNTEMVQSNPEFVKIGIGIIAAVNLLLRAKTKKPLSER